jgi:hypothetical protein
MVLKSWTSENVWSKCLQVGMRAQTKQLQNIRTYTLISCYFLPTAIMFFFHVLESGGEMFRKSRQNITKTRSCGQRRKYSVLCDFIIMKNDCRLWIFVPKYCFANKLW